MLRRGFRNVCFLGPRENRQEMVETVKNYGGSNYCRFGRRSVLSTEGFFSQEPRKGGF